ncbi:MAG: NUDIX hydrolase [Abyssibacter sp.]|jgi:ADP-ribose pyrophosphatase YjhB (NUDIX family)|nr:NUDIX domain-containing protein [Abyssibacter sp.]MCK5859236.1 NUDIX hydrolase [Abyssibacter sp.]
MQYCPQCRTELVSGEHGGAPRRICPDEACNFIHWNNPAPVVAAVVEYNGEVILARNAAWPEWMFGLITGFLEAGETPEDGMLREVKEELGLDGRIGGLIGVYEFIQRNEVIIAYHVEAEGVVELGDELAAWKAVPLDRCKAWPFATGLALRDWLRTRGIEPPMLELPGR